MTCPKRSPASIKAAVLLPGGRKDHRQDAAQLVQLAEGGSRQLDLLFISTDGTALMAELTLTLIWGTASYCPRVWAFIVLAATAGANVGRLWDGAAFSNTRR